MKYLYLVYGTGTVLGFFTQGNAEIITRFKSKN